MKILDIAFKDMTHYFRSAFAVVFMFGVPLLMTGMFYLMFGGTGKNSGTFNLPVTKVVLVNLDQGSPAFDAVKAQLPSGSKASSMGELITSILQEKNIADIMEVTLMDSAEQARSAVNDQKAGAAIIIPTDFSARFSDLSSQATIELYKDPTLTIGPGIIQAVLNQVIDSMSGAKIAITVVTSQTSSVDPTLIGQVVQQYMASETNTDPTAALLDVQNISTTQQQPNILVTIIGPIMGWLTIFYAFYTGSTTAQSILREDEEGTLQRLFTTPTSHSTILGGKFLAVGLIVVVQMIVLFLLGHWIFAIAWGALLPVALVILGVILAAAAFGIFITSLLKSTKQSGLIFGGLLTVLGMLGGIPIFARASSSADLFSKISLIEPVGWAVRGLLQNMNNAPLGDIAVTFVVLVAWSILFFIIGILRFQRRYV